LKYTAWSARAASGFGGAAYAASLALDSCYDSVVVVVVVVATWGAGAKAGRLARFI